MTIHIPDTLLDDESRQCISLCAERIVNDVKFNWTGLSARELYQADRISTEEVTAQCRKWITQLKPLALAEHTGIPLHPELDEQTRVGLLLATYELFAQEIVRHLTTESHLDDDN